MAEKKADVGFEVLSASERLGMARDFLRGRETDAYRAYLARIATPGTTAEYTPDEDEALRALQAEVKRLEKEASDSA